MISQELQTLLEPFFPGGGWERVELVMGLPQGIDARLARAPASYVRRAVAAVTMPHPALRTIGLTVGETIYLDPKFADLETAAGAALFAHEWQHVVQGWTVPDFEQLYSDAAEKTPADRPWENPYEYEAYYVECQAYYRALMEGWPPGDWVPLGVELDLCGKPGAVRPAATWQQYAIPIFWTTTLVGGFVWLLKRPRW